MPGRDGVVVNILHHPFGTCSRSLDALFDDSIPAEPCGLDSCDACALAQLVDDVAITAGVLEGGNGIVVTATTVASNVPPEYVGREVFPRVAAAIHILRDVYASFEVAWSIEQSENGTANVHLLQRRGSTPSLRRLRRVFRGVGLGSWVDMESISRPLSLAAYITKIPLYALRQSNERYGRKCLAFARDLHLGVGLHLRTAGMFPFDAGHRAALAAESRPHVLAWASRFHFDEKMPPRLQEGLSDTFWSELERAEQLRRIGAREEDT